MTTNLTEREDRKLYDVVRRVYERRGPISPRWIAVEAMIELNFPRTLHPIAYEACRQWCEQIARDMCGTKSNADEDDKSESRLREEADAMLAHAAALEAYERDRQPAPPPSDDAA